jgi:hypothetical protein
MYVRESEGERERERERETERKRERKRESAERGKGREKERGGGEREQREGFISWNCSMTRTLGCRITCISWSLQRLERFIHFLRVELKRLLV